MAERLSPVAPERTPFVERLTEVQQNYLYSGLAAIRGQYKEDPRYEGIDIQLSRFVQIASLITQLGLPVPIEDEEAARLKEVWETGDPGNKLGIARDAWHLGLKLVTDETLIDHSFAGLDKIRSWQNDTPLQYKGYSLSGCLVHLKFLGIDAMTPSDTQLIDKEMAKLRSNGDFLSVGRILPVEAAHAKLLGMEFTPTKEEWTQMETEEKKNFALRDNGNYDTLFWTAGSLLNLAIIDSPNPRIENSRIIY